MKKLKTKTKNFSIYKRETEKGGDVIWREYGPFDSLTEARKYLNGRDYAEGTYEIRVVDISEVVETYEITKIVEKV